MEGGFGIDGGLGIDGGGGMVGICNNLAAIERGGGLSCVSARCSLWSRNVLPSAYVAGERPGVPPVDGADGGLLMVALEVAATR